MLEITDKPMEITRTLIPSCISRVVLRVQLLALLYKLIGDNQSPIIIYLNKVIIEVDLL